MPENTERAYRLHWRNFAQWCLVQGVAALPATSETVLTFLKEQARTKTLGTVKMRQWAISKAHREAGLPNPATGHEEIRQFFRQLGAQAPQPKRKQALLPEDLEQLLRQAPMRLKRGRASSPNILVRDRAILLLGFAGGFRRSELVSLNVEDLRFTETGLEVLLHRSKTDQMGRGRTIPIARGSQLCPVQALRDWLTLAGITSGPVFRPIGRWDHVGDTRLQDRAVARTVKRYVEAVGLDRQAFSGNSLRAGLVTAAMRAGKAPSDIRDTTGHLTATGFVAYIRDGCFDRGVASEGLL